MASTSTSRSSSTHSTSSTTTRWLALTFLLSSATTSILASPSPNAHSDPLPRSRSRLVPRQSQRQIPAIGFVSPASAGGSMLTQVANTFPAGLGEPINVVVSAASDPSVLQDQNAFYIWLESINFGAECLGQHIGDHQAANLGDGRGYVNETAVIRYNYGDPQFGTCKETVQGGNHFRLWNQTGSSAFTGALFFATSIEQPANAGHDIQKPNGYDDGRDQLVGNATRSEGTSARNWTFTTTVAYQTGLLPVGDDGINHGLSIDGRVAVLTVKAKAPEGAAAGAAAAAGTSDARRLLQGSHTTTLAVIVSMLGLGLALVAA